MTRVTSAPYSDRDTAVTASVLREALTATLRIVLSGPPFFSIHTSSERQKGEKMQQGYLSSVTMT